jgi:hypothetical protein
MEKFEKEVKFEKRPRGRKMEKFGQVWFYRESDGGWVSEIGLKKRKICTH